MGPAAITRIKQLAQKGEFNKIKSRSDFIDALMDKLIKPAMEMTAEQCKKTVCDTRIAIIEQANKESGSKGKCEAAKELFEKRANKIAEQVIVIEEADETIQATEKKQLAIGA